MKKDIVWKLVLISLVLCVFIQNTALDSYARERNNIHHLEYGKDILIITDCLPISEVNKDFEVY